MKHILFVALTLISFTRVFAVDSDSVFNYFKQHFTFTGYGQTGWTYNDTADPNNDFSIYRIIAMANYAVTDKIDAFIMFDFNKASLHEFWVAYKAHPAFNVKVGQFKTPFSVENPISPTLLEINGQMSLVTAYMIGGASPTMMPAGAGRDIGITAYGKAFNDILSYDIAVMNGEGRNKRDANAQKDFVARLSLKPIEQFSLSASALTGTGHRTVENEDDEENFKRKRFALGATMNVPHLSIRSEYMWGKDDDCKTNGGYVTASVCDVAVKNLDIVASYDHLKAHDETTNRYSAGLQYRFLKKCRVQAVYSHANIHNVGKENAVLTQLQVAF